MLGELATYWAITNQAKGNPDPGPGSGRAPVNTSVIDPKEYDASRALYEQAFNESMAWRPGATAGVAGPTTIGRDDLEARKFQDANIARLQSIAAGGPGGVAAPTAYANLQKGATLTNAVAASRAAPGNAAMAMRSAANTNTAAGAKAENRVAALKAQEQLAAYAALDPALASTRGADFNVAAQQARMNQATALSNAGMQQSVALANQEAWNKKLGLSRAAYGGMTGNDSAFWNAKMAEARAVTGDQDWDHAWNTERQNRRDMQNASYLNTLGTVYSKGSKYASDYNKEWNDEHGTKYWTADPQASDRRVKTNVREVDEDEWRALMVAQFRNGTDKPPPGVRLRGTSPYHGLGPSKGGA